jgi:hypothetical protein
MARVNLKATRLAPALIDMLGRRMPEFLAFPVKFENLSRFGDEGRLSVGTASETLTP